jgi:late competence protein required for DNA uptake (superfamily II DNA/RNA helicase)
MAKKEPISSEIIEKPRNARMIGRSWLIHEHSAYCPECLCMGRENQLSKGSCFRGVELDTCSCALRNGSVCRIQAGKAKELRCKQSKRR